MTQEEILKKGKLSNGEHAEWFEIKTFHPLLNTEVKICIDQITDLKNENQIKILTERINYILNVKKDFKEKLIEVIWKHCEFELKMDHPQVEYKDYSDQETWYPTNQKHFGIYKPEDAYNKAELMGIHADAEFTENAPFYLEYQCPWEQEHGINISVINGEITEVV